MKERSVINYVRSAMPTTTASPQSAQKLCVSISKSPSKNLL